MLLVLAGLVSVPKYLYEAAAIDRVSGWRRFWTITFPYIRGLLMLALLFRTIEAFKLADLVILLTKGGNDTMTISYHVIRIANEQNKTSEGAAISYHPAVHGDRADQSLSLSRQPARAGRPEPWLRLSASGSGWASARPPASARRAGAIRSSPPSSAFIYFLPVLLIIITSFKLQTEALAVPPKFFPTSFFGLIPEQLIFTPTLENFTSVFSRAMVTGGAAESTGFDRYLLQLDLHRRSSRCSSLWSSARSRPTASRAIR